MKKILNNPSDFVDESLRGIVLAHSDMLRSVGDPRVIVRSDAPVRGKVAIATGGGYGHLPVFLGYVGQGLADGACVGNVFSSPSADAMLTVTKSIDGGAGVLYLYGNYFGDKMNFDLAAEMARDEGIQVETVRVTDDVASAPAEQMSKRRGVAGVFFVYKIAGACAESGASLEEVKRLAEEVVINVRTMGIGFSPCTIPASGKPTFEIADNEVEIGIGIHGEPGISRQETAPAKELVSQLLAHLTADLDLVPGDEVSILVNGTGSTPLEELYVAYKEAHSWLSQKGIKIFKPFVGEYATSLEMAGFSISVLKLDETMKALLQAPVNTPFIKQL
ncbi:dihydroxyacetone kinase subunit DhaK [Alicyclobacillus fastidiosus]|uniref:Dihydroxyacetone kinase subunit DhaK n=1 Tax=Alicyclobacillus fastidiosus TaxID=392011 RepID=A0ABY6ZG19_9BACL|nr:dihydroxyacetone kinase subunit DhaK [Alicyclobacillus fastidiosus]WAH41787.1 dihydroxyacetone kinase subunit DhaK [Alicyclobacillus fastidiosus]GMA63482.1 dihydroxyacetone kinase [Alicyclobacillus fastidiosus]